MNSREESRWFHRDSPAARVLFVLREFVSGRAAPALLVGFALASVFAASGCHLGGTPQALTPAAGTPSPAESPGASSPPSPNAGVIIIVIPSPAPVTCVPASVTIPVRQQIVISCTSLGFTGKITATVANPAIASVEVAPGTLTLFYVTGLQIGSTTGSFLTQGGGRGQISIAVTAN